MGYIQCCSIPYAPRFIADVAGVNSWTRCSASSSSASFSASQFVFPSYSHMWCDNYGDKWFILISNFMVLGCSSSQKKVFFLYLFVGHLILWWNNVQSSVLSRWIIWKKVIIWIFLHILLFESQFSWQLYCFYNIVILLFFSLLKNTLKWYDFWRILYQTKIFPYVRGIQLKWQGSHLWNGLPASFKLKGDIDNIQLLNVTLTLHSGVRLSASSSYCQFVALPNIIT